MSSIHCDNDRFIAVLDSAAQPSVRSDVGSRPKPASTGTRFAVCLANDGYKASLEPRKIYAVVPDTDAARHRQLRVVDESGEDYLFPASLFAPIVLRGRVRQAVLAGA